MDKVLLGWKLGMWRERGKRVSLKLPFSLPFLPEGGEKKRWI